MEAIMNDTPIILRLAHDVLCAVTVDEARQMLAALAKEDLQAAQSLTDVLVRAIPDSGLIWKAILDRAKEQEAKPPKPFRWGAKDAAQTADGIDHFLREKRA